MDLVAFIDLVEASTKMLEVSLEEAEASSFLYLLLPSTSIDFQTSPHTRCGLQQTFNNRGNRESCREPSHPNPEASASLVSCGKTLL